MEFNFPLSLKLINGILKFVNQLIYDDNELIEGASPFSMHVRDTL